MTEKEDWIFSLAAEGTRMDPRVGGWILMFTVVSWFD